MNGQSVSQLTGGQEDNYKGEKTKDKDAPAGSVDANKWAQDHPDTGAGSGGGGDVTVTVNPGPGLQNLLTFSGNGVKTAAGAQNGAPPAGTPNSLPNGQSGTAPG